MAHVVEQLNGCLKAETINRESVQVMISCFNQYMPTVLIYHETCVNGLPFHLCLLSIPTKHPSDLQGDPFGVASINSNLAKLSYNKTLVEHLQEYEMSSLVAGL